MDTVDEIEVNNEYNLKRVAEPAGIIASRINASSAITSSIARILMAVKTRCPIIFTYPASLKTDCQKIAKVTKDSGIHGVFFHECDDKEFDKLKTNNLIHDYLDESFLTCDMCPDCCIRSNIKGRFLKIKNNSNDMSLQGIATFKVPARILFKAGCTSRAIYDAREFKKVFIITDFETDFSRQTEYIENCLTSNGMRYYKFTDAIKCQTGKVLNNCMTALNNNKPDAIIAIGTSEIISFAKVAKLIYENPAVKPEDFCESYSEFMRLPVHGVSEHKCALITIPTTYDSSSITPFAYINVDKKFVQISTEDAIPDIAVIDPDRVGFNSSSAFLELVNAIETYCSMASSVYTEGLSIQAAKMLINPHSIDCHETIANGAAITGIAASSSFYGLTKAFTEELYRRYQVPEAATAAAVFPYVVKFLPNDKLAEIARSLDFKSVEELVKAVEFAAKTYNVEKLENFVNKDDLQKHARCITFHVFRNKYVLASQIMPSMMDIENIVRKLL